MRNSWFEMKCRQYARAVKRVDSKSTGFYPHQFKSGCCRIFCFFLLLFRIFKNLNLFLFFVNFKFCFYFVDGKSP